MPRAARGSLGRPEGVVRRPIVAPPRRHV